MRIFILFFPLLFILSCTENDRKKDIETNTYYSKYLFIHQNQDSLGVDKSIELLDEYIKEFPNAQNAYIFKAYLLAKDFKIDKIDTLLSDAIKFDSTNIEIYRYWSALLMMDSTKLKKSEVINNIGLSFKKDDLSLLNNKTWIHLFKSENKEAINNSLNILKNDTTNNYFYMRAAIISNINTDSIYNVLIKRFDPPKNIDFEVVKQFKNNEITLNQVYSSPIKQ